MVKVTVKWNKNVYDDVEIDTTEPVPVFKTQLYTITGVPPDRQKVMGLKGGILKDDADWNALGLKDGLKLTLMGTAEGGELKAPTEKTLFVEDLTPAQKAALLKEKKVDPLPVGLVNLGNTCYLNSVIQLLKPAGEFTSSLKNVPGATPPGATEVEVKLAKAFQGVYDSLENSGQAVIPMSAVKFLRDRYPQFAQQGPRGGYMQQDAEEVLNCLLTSLANALPEQVDGKRSNAIDKAFGFKFQTKYKCLESEAEPEEVKEETGRKLPCFLGTQLSAVDHMHQGVKLALEETIEKNSAVLGRSATYSKLSRLATLPSYLTVHFVRFEWKKAHELSRTDATKAKMCRKVQFPAKLDVWDIAADDLRKKLKPARDVLADRAEKAASQRCGVAKDKDAKAGDKASDDVRMADASSSSSSAAPVTDGDAMDVDHIFTLKPDEEAETGQFELVSVLTHQGRAADSGHYIAWVKKDEDEWLKFDDDTVTPMKWKDLDLAGGRSDFHIAYLCMYRKLKVKPTAEEVALVKKLAPYTPGTAADLKAEDKKGADL